MDNLLTPASDADGSEEADSPDVDLSDPLQRRFVFLVVVFNLAILAAVLGLLLFSFRGMTFVGGGLAAVGVLGLGYGFLTYSRVQRALDAGEYDGESESDADAAN